MTKKKIAPGYRYRENGYEEGIGLVVLRYCSDTSPALASASAENTMALAEIFLSDTASRAKAGDGAGSRRRRMKKSITTGGRSSIQRLGIYLCIFGDGGRIGIVIGIDRQEGLEAT